MGSTESLTVLEQESRVHHQKDLPGGGGPDPESTPFVAPLDGLYIINKTRIMREINKSKISKYLNIGFTVLALRSIKILTNTFR